MGKYLRYGRIRVKRIYREREIVNTVGDRVMAGMKRRQRNNESFTLFWLEFVAAMLVNLDFRIEYSNEDC